jgi:hypothetical protein
MLVVLAMPVVLAVASRTGTTQLIKVHVVHVQRSQHDVLARHGTASLSCQIVSCHIVSCQIVFVSCRVGRPSWTSIHLANVSLTH